MIQIDMSMPTNCLDCPACNEYLMCAIPINGRKWGENDVHEFDRCRPEWCPMEEQEAKTPNLMQDAKEIWSVCPNCGYILRSVVYNLMETDKVKSGFHFPNFCAMCGQAVKWE